MILECRGVVVDFQGRGASEAVEDDELLRDILAWRCVRARLDAGDDRNMVLLDDLQHVREVMEKIDNYGRG